MTTTDPAVHRQARYAKVIRDEHIRLGADQGMTLADFASIARVVIFEADAEAALEPAESIALTVGWAQVQRGEHPSPNVAVVCVATLARLTGRDAAS
jgi:hypothetical protein